MVSLAVVSGKSCVCGVMVSTWVLAAAGTAEGRSLSPGWCQGQYSEGDPVQLLVPEKGGKARQWQPKAGLHRGPGSSFLPRTF